MTNSKAFLTILIGLTVAASGCIDGAAGSDESFEELVSQRDSSSYKVSYTGQDSASGGTLGEPNLTVVNLNGDRKVEPGMDIGVNSVNGDLTYYRKSDIKAECKSIEFEDSPDSFRCSKMNASYLSYPGKYIEKGLEAENITSEGTEKVGSRSCKKFRYNHTRKISYTDANLKRNVELCIDLEKGYVSDLKVELVENIEGPLEEPETITYRVKESKTPEISSIELPVNVVTSKEYRKNGETVLKLYRINDASEVKINSGKLNKTVKFNKGEDTATVNQTEFEEVGAKSIEIYGGKKKQQYLLPE